MKDQPKSDAIAHVKSEIRARILARRAAIPAVQRAHFARQLALMGAAQLPATRSSVISGFLPIGEEIDPVPLMTALSKTRARLCLPVMQGRGKPLIFRGWTPSDDLETRMWGIREPKSDKPVLEPDLMLVPLLAFDADCWRLGYGGGFYDRTLSLYRQRGRSILAIGIAFDEQEVDAVPHLDYDERLDGILTPSSFIRCL